MNNNNRKLIFYSIFDQKYQKKLSILKKRVIIASIIEEKVVFDLSKKVKKTSIGERAVCWIRIYDNQKIYEDYICYNLVYIDSPDGLLLQFGGKIIKVDFDFIFKNILKLFDKNIINPNLSSTQVLYEYKKYLEKKHKKNIKFLHSKKIGLEMDDIEYRIKKEMAIEDYLITIVLKNISKEFYIEIDAKLKEVQY